jgi:hypothetical protein
LKKKFVNLIGDTINTDENGKKVQSLSNNDEIKTISEREWRKIVGMYASINEFDPLSVVSKERVRKTILNGVPHSLRGEIWCMLCKVKYE